MYRKHADVFFVKSIIKELQYSTRTEVISDQLSGPKQQESIANMEYMIAIRYHSVIFSCKMGVPCLCIAYEYKAKGFMNLLDLDAYCVDIYEIDEKLILDKIAEIETNTNAIINRIHKNMPKLEKKANETIQIIENDLVTKDLVCTRYSDDWFVHLNKDIKKSVKKSVKKAVKIEVECSASLDNEMYNESI